MAMNQAVTDVYARFGKYYTLNDHITMENFMGIQNYFIGSMY